MKKCQSNIKDIIAAIDSWGNIRLFERKDGLKENLMWLDNRTDRVKKRYEIIRASRAEIMTILEQSYNLFFDVPPEKTEEDEVCKFTI